MQEIRHGVHVETGHRGSNNVIVETADGLVLIDAPHLPSDAVRYRDMVAAMGKVRYLIFTDHHIDHTLGARWLPGAVVGHARTREQLAVGAPDRQWLHDTLSVLDPPGLALMADWRPRLPEVTFEQGLTLHVGDVRIELITVVGHTVNTAVVLLPDHGVLIAGDDVCESCLPSFQDAAVHEMFANLEMLAGMAGFDLVVPGHGEVSGRSVIAQFRSEALAVVAGVTEAIEAGVGREQVIESVRFEDRIHTSAGGDPGYPNVYIEAWQRSSMAAIYDQLVAEGPISQAGDGVSQC